MIALAGLVVLAATATATVKPGAVEVGDPVPITVRVTARPNATVTLRPPAPNIPVYTVAPGGNRVQQADANGFAEFTFEVVPWTHGDVRVGPAAAEILGQGQILANPISLRAENPLGADAATRALADIRDIRPFPEPERPWLLLVGALVFGAIAAWLFLSQLRRKPAAAPAAAPKPPPREERSLAEWMDAVRRIAERPPRDAEAAREAHFTIAEAIRRFVEERWEIPASKQTTEEFLEEAARSSRFRGGGMSILPVVLEACDRVKWAGDRVAAQDTLEVAKLALDFFAASRGAYRGLGDERMQPDKGGRGTGGSPPGGRSEPEGRASPERGDVR